MERPRTGFGNGVGFNTKQYAGSLSLVPVPSAKELAAFTQTALANLRYPLLAQAKLPRARKPAGAARAGTRRRTERVPARHLHHQGKPHLRSGARRREGRQRQRGLVRVRRTRHAQRTQARPRFCAAGQHVLLRHLERRRPSMDRQRHRHGLRGARICRLAAQLSQRRRRRGHGRTRWPIRRRVSSGTTRSRTAKRFAISANSPPTTKHWKDPARKGKPGFLDCYRDFVSGANAIALIGASRTSKRCGLTSMTNTIGWDLDVPDVWRAAQFIKELKQFEAADNLPNLRHPLAAQRPHQRHQIRFAHARSAGGRQRPGVRPDRRGRQPQPILDEHLHFCHRGRSRRTAGTT